MVEIIKSKKRLKQFLEDISNRGQFFDDEIEKSVQNILNDVKENGDSACLKYTKQFDRVVLNENEVPVKKSEIEDAYHQIQAKTLKAIRKAKSNIEKFHKAQLKEYFKIETTLGVKVGQLPIPYDSIGIYVPGGRAPYPSTVLMTAVPAKIAGINRIIMTTPPDSNKEIHPAILVAAKESGVDKIYKLGGVQAIAAMAFGTKLIKKVNKIVGPGNKFVNLAKVLVNREVAIDLPAGPSEILIIADKYSNPSFIADDIISQSEHDPDAFSFLISSSDQLLYEVYGKIFDSLKNYKRKNIIEKSLKNNCYLILSKDINQMFEISNTIAPEHLEIHLKDYNRYIPLIKNAGAVFIGEFSPVPIGDYAAGSNHVLPTGGQSRIYSGLSIHDFVKYVNVVECSKKGLKNLKKSVIELADIEGFDAHKKTILGRLEE
ncbi:MAG: histidinol dehydrogenase [Candidatus Lokiarchaeota archaeon]|nr:histidinol dehydrogenase [Candidatus Lokiarchaeota archaeon]